MIHKKSDDPVGMVRVQPTYAIPHKDGRAELVFGDPVDQPCLHSLFPHMGYAPCWYLNRQNQKTTVMVLLIFPSRSLVNLSVATDPQRTDSSR